MAIRSTSGVQYSGGGIGLKGVGVLAQSGVAASTSSASAATLATIAIPANEITSNGALRVKTFWSYPNSANAKSFQVLYGGQQACSYSGVITSAASPCVSECLIINQAAANAQVANSSTTGTTSESAGSSSLTVNSAQAQNLVIQANTNGTETITLLSYLVEVINP